MAAPDKIDPALGAHLDRQSRENDRWCNDAQTTIVALAAKNQALEARILALEQKQ